ncbi:MAG TPA: hypothetical protein VGQ62_07570 [Chloroflexota bacterium]|nr:hypothetical protein [Chloroflexota bacterium]
MPLAAGARGESPFCAPGQVPAFPPEGLALQVELGETMGVPIECPHADLVTRDSIQATTTGLSFFRSTTNTPTFTNGQQHWALTPAGVLAWAGAGSDPPASAADRLGVGPPTYRVTSAASAVGPGTSAVVEGDLEGTRRAFLRVLSIPPGARVTIYAGDAPAVLVTAPWAAEVPLPDSPQTTHWVAQVFKEESHVPSVLAVQLLEIALISE